MRRRLSSQATFLWKVILPSTWVAAFTAASVILAVKQPPGVPWFVFPVLTIGGALMFWRLCWPLQRVHLEGDTLIVSNFLREIHVPLSEITEVTERRGTNPAAVTLRLRRKSPLGGKITFVPKHEWVVISEHALTRELRALAGLPQGRPAEPHPNALPVSSKHTLTLKVVLPLAFTLAANLPLLIDSRLAVLGLLAVPFGLAWLLALRLKRVVAVDGRLVVSTLTREIDVRADDIGTMRVLRIVGVALTRVSLTSPSEFGQTFVFLPRAMFAAPEKVRASVAR